MTNPFHTTLAGGRWQTLTLCEQLGNIGSEVERTFLRKKAGDTEGFQSAFIRALELFDLTASDPRWRGRLKEILRAREVFCDTAHGENEFCATPEELSQYYLEFAIAARLHR